MSFAWLVITLSSLCALLVFSPDGALASMTAGANKAVSLSLTLVAVYSVWLGLFDLIESVGLADKLSRAIKKPVAWLFPSSDSKARKLASLNLASNLLGLGNAATPIGINAAYAMYKGDSVATDDMIMLLVLSSTSLQLIPSTVISLRVSHGSLRPTSFLPACVIATVISTLLGVILCKIIAGLRKKRAKVKQNKRKSV